MYQVMDGQERHTSVSMLPTRVLFDRRRSAECHWWGLAWDLNTRRMQSWLHEWSFPLNASGLRSICESLPWPHQWSCNGKAFSLAWGRLSWCSSWIFYSKNAWGAWKIELWSSSNLVVALERATLDGERITFRCWDLSVQEDEKLSHLNWFFKMKWSHLQAVVAGIVVRPAKLLLSDWIVEAI